MACPGATEESVPASGGIQAGAVLTGDGMDAPAGMVAFPGSTEESVPVGGGIQEGTVLSGEGMDGHPGMATSAAGDEDQVPGGVVPGEAGFVGTTLDSTSEAPQFGSVQPEGLNVSGTTVVPGDMVSGGGSEPPAASSFAEDPNDTQHFGGASYGGGPISFHGANQFGGGAEDGHQSGNYGGSGDYHGVYSEAPLVAATFPAAPEGTMLRTVGDGVIEASSPDGGNTLWYNSAYFQEPDAPHTVMQSANGVDWYAMQQQADIPQFEAGDAAAAYNQATFQNFMPGYELPVSQVDGAHRQDGHFEVRHDDGSGTKFYDTARYAAPRGDYQVYEDARGSQWYAIRGEAAVDRKPVYEGGKPVYDDGKLRTVNVETVRYKQTPARFAEPEKRGDIERKPPRRKM